VTDPNPGWVSPIVPVGKSNGDLRLCVDMRKANLAIVREAYPLPTFEKIVARLRKATVFSKLDLKNAYHQVEITPDSRHITTFTTCRGLFRYTRLMFGISCAPEKFQKIIDRVLQDCDGAVAYIDDVLIFGVNEQEHDERLEKVLNVFQQYDILLNRAKCIFKSSEVVFMGHKLSSAGISPLESKIEAIKRFREPENMEEVRSFLGLVQYHARFIPDLASKSEPLRILLKNDQPFVWDEAQRKAFRLLKGCISSEDTLGYFDILDKTKLICDASPVGLGAVLLQEDRESQTSRIIAYASRSLSEVEKKYYQTEKEALSLVWGVERFKYYLMGLQFELVTDCKPLEFLFTPGSKPCARIERWILRLQSFHYTVKFKPGKTNVADPLSRLVVQKMTREFDKDTEEYVFHVITAVNSKVFSLEEFKEHTLSDNQLNLLKDALKTDRWDKMVAPFHAFRTEICEHDDFLLRGTRLIPPGILRKRIVEIAHEGHLGMTKMKQRLRASYWWPGMDKEVESFVKNCRSCILVGAPDPPPPVARRELPDGAWQHLAVDFLGPLGRQSEYVFVVVDYFSRFMELVIMKTTTTDRVILALRTMIGRYGYPISITADNGPQFRSLEFANFCRDEGIILNLTTPYWPQANGEVERQNRSLLKRIKISIQEDSDWKEDLLKYQAAYHVTPHSVTGRSPAELFFGATRDKFPIISRNFKMFDESIRDRDRELKEKGKEYADNKRKAGDSEIVEGDTVVAKKMRKENKLDPTFDPTEHTVLEKRGNETIIGSNQTGQEYRRHVQHLKKVPTTENRSLEINDGPVDITATPLAPETTPVIQNDTTHSTTHVEPQNTSAPAPSGRSKRTTRKPGYLLDYI
jgi:transposase InsO family protein